MQNATGTAFITSEQYKESTHARIDRDQKDIEELGGYFQNSIKSDYFLGNITMGMAADTLVSADRAKNIDFNILHKMKGEYEGFHEKTRYTPNLKK